MFLNRRRTALAGAVVGIGAFSTLNYASSSRRECTNAAEASSVATALPTVQKLGFALIRGAIPAASLMHCKQTDAFREMPASALESQTDTWRLSAFGRFHRVQFSQSDSTAFAALEHLWEPLVVSYFENVERRLIYRSELQLLTAAPWVSQDQMWHSGNRSEGLTIVVPLVDFTLDNGATQLLPGTHDPRLSSMPLMGEGARILTPKLGDIAVYDARTYHRGLGNASGHSRPALVFRYDHCDSPPPGVGVFGSLAHAGLARLIHATTAARMATLDAMKPPE